MNIKKQQIIYEGTWATSVFEIILFDWNHEEFIMKSKYRV